MARNNKFKDNYIKFMKELTSKGYAKLLNQIIAGTYHTMVCTTQLCKEGGFNLMKFSGNNLDVLKTIQDKDKKDKKTRIKRC